MDHGILNLPLAKRGRGDIDSQIDRYKREKKAAEAAEHKERVAAFKSNKAIAKVNLAELYADVAWMNDAASKFGVTRKYLADELRSLATWQPRKLIAIHASYLREKSA